MSDPDRAEPSGAQEPAASDYVSGVLAGDRTWLARAVTLVESTLPADRSTATEVLERLAPHAADAHRVGVTGPPGAGKSTLIDALGMYLCEQGHRVAVLAVDPSSAVSGGSILGDKTRMALLASAPEAFVRPSPSGGALGGVTGATLEAVEVVEAAGYDVVFIETVGVGQSEAGVADICDTVLTVTSPAGGDELQGIKRGLFEVTDVLVVNKADGDLKAAAQRTVADYAAALRLLHPRGSGESGAPAWEPPVLAASALEGTGLSELWAQVRAHAETLRAAGEWSTRRGDQRVRWMWHLANRQLLTALRDHPQAKALLPDLTEQVRHGRLQPARAAAQLTRLVGAAGS
ncbi:MAG: methylmalonyl Co-A mutase-associated GTPase MeaB [Acidimicrobiia bacterium]|nr:methylmalonyl Co-A mutase-associated GTPase MeaB [Acidimicrobiia bacterium]MYC46444.1 methylmalonyl Co-A mutase-associated GTPase MeaB [Acidimicrobiia bacterium]